MVSEAKKRANARYNVRTYETVSARALKSERMNDRITAAAAKAGESRAGYILSAIRARLDADGVTLESLDD